MSHAAPVKIDDVDIELMDRALCDEEGLGLAESKLEERRVTKLAKLGYVRIESAMPGTPTAFATTLEGARVLDVLR